LIFPSSHICVRLSLASCHTFVSSNISSTFVQSLTPASRSRSAELSWCFVLRMRASTFSISPLARESSGRVTGFMLETSSPLCQSALPE
jgi:hypothetical protein